MGGLTWIPEITGFNNSGSAVGFWTQYQQKGIEQIASKGFVSNNNSIPSGFSVPGMSYTFASAINDAGQIIGGCSNDGLGLLNHGIIISGPTGTPQIFNYPDATNTEFSGINGIGQIVGSIGGSESHHPFIYENGQFTIFNVDGAIYMSFTGINNNGQIVGSYCDDVNYNWHGFLFDRNSNKIIPFDYPFQSVGAHLSRTCAFGINDFGQISGMYVVTTNGDKPTNSVYYFLATPQLQ